MQKTFRILPIALCCLLFVASCGKSDKSTRYISKDAVGVVSINTAQLIKKVGLSMLSGSDILKEMTKGRDAGDTASLNIEAMGIQYLATIYIYAVPDQRLSGRSRFMAVAPLKDAARFGEFIKKNIPEAKHSTKGDLSLAVSGNACIGWDKNTAIIAVSPARSEWEDMAPAAAATADAGVILSEEVQKAFAMPESESMASNNKFNDLVKAGHDVSFWLNYESLMNSLPQEQIGQAGTIMASQKRLLKDAYVAGGVNFDNGKITGDATYYFNSSVKAIADALEAKSANDDLLKKVQGKQLNLLMSYHINPKGIKTMLDTMGASGFAGLALKEYGLTLDEVLDAFSGDFLLAVTDFSVATESQSYTMGGNSVNYTKPVPSYKASLSFKLKNKAAFDKVLQAAISNQVLTSTAPNTYSAGFLHLITNGEYVALSDQPAVASAYLQATGNDFKVPSEVKNSPFGFFMDIRNSIQAVPLDLLYGKQDTALFHDGRNLLENISAHGGKVNGDHSDFHFEATFVNKEKNSLLQIIEFAQKVAEAEKKESDSFDDIVPDTDTAEIAVDTVAPAI
jgi:hypothetical protein